jgi:Excreted virulence factor EspC, type VII ESX diderm
MGHIEVNPDELSSLASGLHQFSSAGAEAKAGLTGIGSAQTGHGGLADAVSDFVHAWDYSLKKIGENAAAMADKVGKAGDGYRGTDRAIADAASGDG